jgi:hypothetical protein
LHVLRRTRRRVALSTIEHADASSRHAWAIGKRERSARERDDAD